MEHSRVFQILSVLIKRWTGVITNRESTWIAGLEICWYRSYLWGMVGDNSWEQFELPRPSIQGWTCEKKCPPGNYPPGYLDHALLCNNFGKINIISHFRCWNRVISTHNTLIELPQKFDVLYASKFFGSDWHSDTQVATGILIKYMGSFTLSHTFEQKF